MTAKSVPWMDLSMRITRQTLLRIAKDTVSRRKSVERDLLAVYLQGSLLEDDPVLGGTADIDLVFIYNSDPVRPREISRLTDEVHLDLEHQGRKLYRDGRNLRYHPRLGPAIYGCKILHDPQHFLDFLQAGVRGHYHRSDTILTRAQSWLKKGRDIWFDFYRQAPEPGPTAVSRYLEAVEGAANAVASLTGPPLPERRFLLQLPSRTAEVGKPGLYMGVLGLLGASGIDETRLAAWLPTWAEAMEEVGAQMSCPPLLHPHRRGYYQRGLEAILEGPQPMAALWPMFWTWTQAICHLGGESEAYPGWQAVCEQMELGAAQFPARVAALDAFLDAVEETLEQWGQARGV